MADDLNYILFLFEIFHVIKLHSFFYGSIVLLQSYYRDYTDEHPFTYAPCIGKRTEESLLLTNIILWFERFEFLDFT